MQNKIIKYEDNENINETGNARMVHLLLHMNNTKRQVLMMCARWQHPLVATCESTLPTQRGRNSDSEDTITMLHGDQQTSDSPVHNAASKGHSTPLKWKLQWGHRGPCYKHHQWEIFLVRGDDSERLTRLNSVKDGYTTRLTRLRLPSCSLAGRVKHGDTLSAQLTHCS